MGYVTIIDIGRLDIFTCIILMLFALSIVIQLAYYLFVYMKVVLRTEKQKTYADHSALPVSVIICARNDEEMLVQNLPLILEQDYPSYEVIVVNDCSVDNTEQVLAEFKQKYPHLRSTIIRKDGSFLNNKKFAVTIGIKAAQYEWLLCTEANSRPENNRWIAAMSKCFADRKSIVLGYGGYLVQKGFLNKWIRYNTCFTGLQYFGYAKVGKAYTGVGRNLAYRKSLFYAHNGFAEHAHVPSGDNDLLVNRAATRWNVAMTYSKDAHTRTAPQKSLKEWMRHKRWHFFTSRYYKKSQIFFLTLEPFSRVLMWASFFVLMFFCPFWEYILIMFLMRKIIFMSVIGGATKRFNEPGILKHAIFFDLVMPFVYFYVFLLNRIALKHNKWK